MDSTREASCATSAADVPRNDSPTYVSATASKFSVEQRDLKGGHFLASAEDPSLVHDRASGSLDFRDEAKEQVVVVFRAKNDLGHGAVQRRVDRRLAPGGSEATVRRKASVSNDLLAIKARCIGIAVIEELETPAASEGELDLDIAAY